MGKRKPARGHRDNGKKVVEVPDPGTASAARAAGARSREPGAADPATSGAAAAETPAAPGKEDTPDIAEAGAQPSPERNEAELLKRIEALEQEKNELQDKYLRLAAEFDNFRKRNAREWQDYRKRATAEVLREVLEIADNLQRAIDADSEDAAGLRQGVVLIEQQLQSLLKRFGIETVDAKGKPFDPTKHEAVLVVDSDEVASQHVVDVVQEGYSLNGEILRPARVTVSR